MSKISLFTFVAIVLILYFKSVASEDAREDDQSNYSNIWFGPRIGRRKRNLIGDTYKDIDKENLDVLLDFIRKSPWTIMLFNHGRGQRMNFDPKLGRGPPEGISEAADITEVVERSMFAPRLGRSMFAPRLGRNTDIELE